MDSITPITSLTIALLVVTGSLSFMVQESSAIPLTQRNRERRSTTINIILCDEADSCHFNQLWEIQRDNRECFPLSSNLNDRVSSVRFNSGDGCIVLYDHANCRGSNTLRVTASGRFDEMFNDKASAFKLC